MKKSPAGLLHHVHLLEDCIKHSHLKHCYDMNYPTVFTVTKSPVNLNKTQLTHEATYKNNPTNDLSDYVIILLFCYLSNNLLISAFFFLPHVV